MPEPVVANTDAEISKCFPVVAELRPHLDEASFVAMVRGMETEGYRLAYIEASGKALLDWLRDLASFHFSEKLDKL